MNDRIVLLLRKAAESMSDSITRYWPAWGNNELAERNQTIHIAGALLRRGWHCWTEAHWNGSARRKLDLLAWEQRSRTLLMIEGKRVYTVEKISSLMRDIERIDSFLPIEHPEVEDRLAPQRRFGVLVATTWSPRVKHWWTGDDKGAWSGASALWARTRARSIKAATSGEWGAIPLKTLSTDGALGLHHLLYAVWRL